VYRNKNRRSVPYIRRPFLKLDSQSYRLNHLLLRIPTTPRNFIFLILEGSEHYLSYIDDLTLKRGSVTITEHSVTIAFSKEVKMFEPVGYIGIDVNEKNIAVSATDRFEKKFDELGEVVEIREPLS
jgi:transposase